MADLSEWRNRIDEIDGQLLDLLNERAANAIMIGKFKAERNLEVHDPDREKKILDHLCANNRGPLSNEAVRRLFDCMFKESKRLEHGGDER